MLDFSYFFDYLFCCKCYRIKWQRIERMIRFDDWKNNPKEYRKYFYANPNMDVIGYRWLAICCLDRYNELISPSRNLRERRSSPKFMAKRARWVARRRQYLRTSAGAPDPRFFLFYSAGDRQFENWMQVDRIRKKEKHFHTQFLRCLFWTVGVPKWTFSPFSRINHGDERIIKKEWKIYFEREKAGEKSFYSIANEGLASKISFLRWFML